MNAKISIIACLTCLAVFLAGCKDDDNEKPEGIQPPDIITQAFNAKYPGITQVEWNVADNYYVADFENDSTSVDAWFSDNGTWMMEEAELRVTLIPDDIQNAIQQGAYASWMVDDASIINRAGMGTVYKVEVKKNSQEVDLYYTEFGNLIKTVEDTDTNTEQPIPIPAEVKTLMELTFPGAILLDIIPNSSGYLLALLDKNIYKTSQLNKEYRWQNTTWEITEQQVPAIVMQGFESSAYANDQVESIYVLINADGTFYKFNLIQNNQPISVKFDVFGNIDN